MSTTIRWAIATAMALAIMVTAAVAQTAVANADPVCAEAAYTVLGTISDNQGGCVSTTYHTFLEVDQTTGDPSLIEVKVHVSIVLP